MKWNLGPGRTEFVPRIDPHDWFPILVELKDGMSAADFAAGTTLFADEASREAWRRHIRVPPFYTTALQAHKLRYVTLLAHADLLARLGEKQIADALDAATIAVSPPLSRSCFPEGGVHALTAAPLAGTRQQPPAGVIVGIIDDGIAFAHERFRAPGGGSRVEYFWMQDGPSPGPVDLGLPGLELDKAAIDRLLEDCTFSGLVDEDALYRRARVADFRKPGHKPIAWRLAHGTHVLDLAGGYPPDVAPDWRIIAVQLPIATTGMPVASTLATYLIEGLYYILARSLAVAARLNCGPLPVVINISYGITDGPHDGTHIVERAIDHIVAGWRELFGVEARVVIASGNSYLDRLHAEVRFQDQQQSVVIPWRVQPDGQTASVVEVWLPPGAAPESRISLRVAAPRGMGGTAALGEIPGGSSQWVVNDDVLCEADYFRFPEPTGRGMFRIYVQPTARTDAPGPVAPAGLWHVILQNEGLAAADVVHAWVRRSEAPYGYPRRGRQSYFDDPAYRRFDGAGREIEVDQSGSIVKRAATINGLATGVEPAVVGGVERKELQPSEYSAGGPAAERDGPDALTVSEDSEVHRGVLAAGTRSGSVVAMNGTSVAAPRLAREIARILAEGGSGSRDTVRALAAAREAGLPPPKPDRRRGGAGRLVLPPVHPVPRFER